MSFGDERVHLRSQIARDVILNYYALYMNNESFAVYSNVKPRDRNTEMGH